MFWIGTLALTACMFVSPQQNAEGLPAAEPPAFFNRTENCTCCHDTQGQGTDVDPHSFSFDITESCMNCHHREKIGRSHPVGVRSEERFPDMEIPENLPLDEDERVTCGTCHNPHLDTYSTQRYAISQDRVVTRSDSGSEIALYKTYMLRVHAPDAGNDPTCASCHADLFSPRTNKRYLRKGGTVMKVWKILQSLECLEESMSRFYNALRLHYVRDTEVAAFYARMRDEEYCHRDIVRYQQRIMFRSPDNYLDLEDYDQAALETTLSTLEDLIAREADLPLSEALRSAVALETSATEQHYRSIIGRANPALGTLVKNLGSCDTEHAARLSTFAQSHGASPSFGAN